jgi:hypothetical protein
MEMLASLFTTIEISARSTAPRQVVDDFNCQKQQHVHEQ